MKIDVAFLPTEVKEVDLANTTCIVLDIFRATTSIVTAMSNGCRAIIPVLSVEEAWQLARQRKSVLLAGERQSIKIEGFDFGNSPHDFSQDKVQGQEIVMTTSNGTIAIKATEGACHTLIGSFSNSEAVCQRAQIYGKDVLIVCAGTDRLFSLEDALCAGYLAEKLSGDTEAILTDAARGALLMYLEARENLVKAAKNSRNGQRLLDLGRQQDVEYCFQRNLFAIVPEYRDGQITL